MTFENLVDEYNRLKFKVKRLELKIEEFRLLGEYPKVGDGTPKSKNPSSIVENVVSKISLLAEKKKSLEVDVLRLREKILRIIDDTLQSINEKEIVELKTFSKSISWDEISRKVFLSESRTRHIYQNAIEKINQFLAKEKNNDI